MRILQQVIAGARSVIRVVRTDCAGTMCRWGMETRNVCRFRAEAIGGPTSPPQAAPRGGGLHQSREITIDGQPLSLKGLPVSSLLDPAMTFCRACELGKRDWALCRDGKEYQRHQRGPGNWGPF